MTIQGLMTAEQPIQKQIIMGLVPCQNQYVIDLIWPVIKPGLVELADASMGETTEFQAYQEVYSGSTQIFMIYLDGTGVATQDKFQESFVEKLKTPEKDYVGFLAIQLLKTSLHIPAAYIKPEFRNSKIASMALDFIEQRAVKMGAPYVSLATHQELDIALKHRGYSSLTVNFRKKI